MSVCGFLGHNQWSVAIDGSTMESAQGKRLAARDSLARECDSRGIGVHEVLRFTQGGNDG